MKAQEAFDALGVTYVEIVDDGNTYIIRGEGAQDMKDGAALRKLRELVPYHIEASWRHDSQGRWEDRWWVRVDYPVKDDLDFVTGEGATIAAAADKCREAMG